jgi:hypothetical protein
VITALDAAITAYRHAEVTGVSRPKASNYVKAECECPRVIRVGKTVLTQAPIICGGCGKEFCAEEAGDEDQDSDSPVSAGPSSTRPYRPPTASANRQ